MYIKRASSKTYRLAFFCISCCFCICCCWAVGGATGCGQFNRWLITWLKCVTCMCPWCRLVGVFPWCPETWWLATTWWVAAWVWPGVKLGAGWGWTGACVGTNACCGKTPCWCECWCGLTDWWGDIGEWGWLGIFRAGIWWPTVEWGGTEWVMWGKWGEVWWCGWEWACCTGDGWWWIVCVAVVSLVGTETDILGTLCAWLVMGCKKI